jgi:hypothetical protein
LHEAEEAIFSQVANLSFRILESAMNPKGKENLPNKFSNGTQRRGDCRETR